MIGNRATIMPQYGLIGNMMMMIMPQSCHNDRSTARHKRRPTAVSVSLLPAEPSGSHVSTIAGHESCKGNAAHALLTCLDGAPRPPWLNTHHILAASNDHTLHLLPQQLLLQQLRHVGVPQTSLADCQAMWLTCVINCRHAIAKTMQQLLHVGVPQCSLTNCRSRATAWRRMHMPWALCGKCASLNCLGTTVAASTPALTASASQATHSNMRQSQPGGQLVALGAMTQLHSRQSMLHSLTLRTCAANLPHSPRAPQCDHHTPAMHHVLLCTCCLNTCSCQATASQATPKPFNCFFSS
jgi:hypothetical protein